MKTPVEKNQKDKSQATPNLLTQKKENPKTAFPFIDNRPQAIAQRKRQEMINRSPQVMQLRAFQDLVNKSQQATPIIQKKEQPPVQLLKRPNAPTFVPSPTRPTKSATPRNEGVIQAKMFFVPNKHYLADPNDLTIHNVNQYQQWFTMAVGALADNADAAAAIAAINVAFAHHGLDAVYRLRWAGNHVFLETREGRQLENLGSVAHDQDPNLYIAHPVAGGQNIHVNRSDRSQHVQDSSGQYMERFVKRSLAIPDLGNLRRQNDLRGPNRNDRTTLDHVTGMNDGDFLSFSTDPNDVMNAHGNMFNASQRGRVEVDLAHMAAANVNNLSTRAGIRANIRPQLGGYGRQNIDQIMTQAEARADAERAAGQAPALVAGDVGAARQTAGDNNPHHRRNLPNIQYQAIVDAFRTKEVLLEGSVPFHSITRYHANAAPHRVGAPVTAAIAGNLAASQALTQAADQTLTRAEQIPHVIPAAAYQQQLPRINNRLNALMNIHFKENKIRTGDQIPERNKQYKKALKAEKSRLNNEAAHLALLYQRRSNAGWANATPADLRVRLQLLINQAPALFGAIQRP